ncbi:MAG: DNA-directed RNA polymerase subunit alpha [Candidatus Doudnabacteria bacterium]|nr:DNA-directed RNA polymerase subunit alpha [Candidatus Doudnabacteria bacterium]
MEAIPLPNRAKVESLGGNKYKLVLEPLYPGYGVTVGNALRRVLLSSMPGSAVTGVKIKFVDHEFSTIPNVKEDVIQILLQLKQLRIDSASSEPARLQLKVKGEKNVTAADIKETDQVKIINKDLHIATLDNKNADFEMELVVEQGRGYLPVELRENQKNEIGMIALDAVFTPVRSVYFDISNVRVGQFTNFDKLEVVMETDGSIDGSAAVNIAAHILVDHFSMLFSEESPASADRRELEGPQASLQPETQNQPVQISEDNEILNSTLSTRAKNALIKNGIVTLEALRALSNEQIGAIEGLGKKTISEILEFLGSGI